MYLALGGGPPRFPQASSWPVVLGYRTQAKISASYGTLTLCGQPFQAVPKTYPHLALINPHPHTAHSPQPKPPSCERSPIREKARRTGQGDSVGPTTPLCKHNGLGSSPVARRYWGNHICFLFLRVLRCFSSPRALSLLSDWPLRQPGYPIRKPVDPCLLAAPYGISSLGTSFVGTLPQGIHQTPYVALNTYKPIASHNRSNVPSFQKTRPRFATATARPRHMPSTPLPFPPANTSLPPAKLKDRPEPANRRTTGKHNTRRHHCKPHRHTTNYYPAHSALTLPSRKRKADTLRALRNRSIRAITHNPCILHTLLYSVVKEQGLIFTIYAVKRLVYQPGSSPDQTCLQP